MNNNKKRGNTYELSVINRLQSIYSEKLYSTRNVSKFLDDKKIDITNEKNDMDINYQIKTTSTAINYIQILNEMPTDKVNIIINKRTVKKSDKFYSLGEIVVMSFDDYIKIKNKI